MLATASSGTLKLCAGSRMSVVSSDFARQNGETHEVRHAAELIVVHNVTRVVTLQWRILSTGWNRFTLQEGSALAREDSETCLTRRPICTRCRASDLFAMSLVSFSLYSAPSLKQVRGRTELGERLVHVLRLLRVEHAPVKRAKRLPRRLGPTPSHANQREGSDQVREEYSERDGDSPTDAARREERAWR